MKKHQQEYVHLENLIKTLSENLGANNSKQNLLNLLYTAVDRAAILYAIQKFKNNKSKTAKFLGISRGTLQKKLQNLNLDNMILG